MLDIEVSTGCLETSKYWAALPTKRWAFWEFLVGRAPACWREGTWLLRPLPYPSPAPMQVDSAPRRDFPQPARSSFFLATWQPAEPSMRSPEGCRYPILLSRLRLEWVAINSRALSRSRQRH